jgi:hypothetical protein
MEGKPSQDISFEDEACYYKGRLWIPDDLQLPKQILYAVHDSQVSAHIGQDKTIELIRRNFFLPEMEQFIEDCVRLCPDCQSNKEAYDDHNRLLQPLELVYHPSDSIPMDFIIELPVSDRCSLVWVIVDRFTKMAHFIALQDREKRTQDLVKIIWKEVWRFSGLPSTTVSDWDSRFTSTFWSSLV